MASLKIPENYTSLPWRQIKVTSHPVDAASGSTNMVITINRPEKNNSFTEQIENEMITAINLFDVDDRVKVVVVTGAGRCFCAGADLDIGLERYPGESSKDHRDVAADCPWQFIDAVNLSLRPFKAQLLVGITMTLPMSLRVVSATAKVGFVFAQRGVVMEACSSFFLPRLIGYSRALYLAITGSVLPATSPILQDLFAEILPSPGKVLPRALELATQIARNTSTVSTYLMKEMMRRNPGSSEGTHLLDSEIMFQLYDKADKDEGIKSFLEKRPAKITGSVNSDIPECLPWWQPVDVDKKKRKHVVSKM